MVVCFCNNVLCNTLLQRACMYFCSPVHMKDLGHAVVYKRYNLHITADGYKQLKIYILNTGLCVLKMLGFNVESVGFTIESTIHTFHEFHEVLPLNLNWVKYFQSDKNARNNVTLNKTVLYSH